MDMVNYQIRGRGVTDRDVLDAMERVPRHEFVLPQHKKQAYADHPLPIGYGQTISQPYIVALMTELLELKNTDRVLEIGTGSGYQAAVLAQIVSRVFTIERIYSLFTRTRKLFDQLRYHNIATRYSDGTNGWADESPFDAIIVTAGAPRVPEVLARQLVVGGRMVLPVGNAYSQELIRLVRTERGIEQSNLGGCRFVKLVGEHGWKED
jgi:protein-L-isoaspartate(D-aspartate) O-methyltransferase